MGITAEQLERRRTGLGASDVAALFGLDPHKNELDVWYSKTGKLEASDDTSEAMEIGNDFEAPLIDWTKGILQRQQGKELPLRKNMERRQGCFLVHLDAALLSSDTIIEAKTAGRPDHPDVLRRWGKTTLEAPTDAVSTPTRIQAQTQMGVAGKTKNYVPLLTGTFFCLERRLYLVKIDQEMVDMIFAKGEAWWQRHVVDGEMPTPMKNGNLMTPSKRTLDRIIRNPNTWAQVTEEILSRYIAASAASGRAKKEIEAATNALKHAAGDCDGVRCDSDPELPEVTLHLQKGRLSHGMGLQYEDYCETCNIGSKRGKSYRVPRKRKRSD